jgi:hypothetical protein
MSFIKNASPRKAGSDLWALLREKRNDRLPLMLAACIPPLAIFLAVNNDVNKRMEKPASEVIYFESWPSTRTREESLTAIQENQKQKDRAMAAQREAYKAMGRATGIDVDRMEKEALDAEAKRKAANAKAIENSMKASAGASK